MEILHFQPMSLPTQVVPFPSQKKLFLRTPFTLRRRLFFLSLPPTHNLFIRWIRNMIMSLSDRAQL